MNLANANFKGELKHHSAWIVTQMQGADCQLISNFFQNTSKAYHNCVALVSAY